MTVRENLVTILDAIVADGHATGKNQTQENMITVKMVRHLENQVGKDRAEKLYADAGLDLSDPHERNRHRTLKTMVGILNKEWREQSSSGAAADSVFAKNLPDAPISGRTAVPASSPLKAARPSREVCLEAIQQISELESLEKFERMTDKQVWNSLEKLCFQNHVRIPAMRPDTELAETHWRTEKPTGIARTMRADRQQKLNSLFNIQPL
jgi:hypothetical protein